GCGSVGENAGTRCRAYYPLCKIDCNGLLGKLDTLCDFDDTYDELDTDRLLTMFMGCLSEWQFPHNEQIRIKGF
ncbi:Hypothetical predicted protein, partial [Pelobates cultripes]